MSEYSQPELLEIVPYAELLEMVAYAMRRRDDWWREFEKIRNFDDAGQPIWATGVSRNQIFEALLYAPHHIRPAPRRRYAYMHDGTEVSWPEPVWETLDCDQIYYVANPTLVNKPIAVRWKGDWEDWVFLKQGRIHLTPEAAKEHRDAEIILAGGTPPGGENE